MRTTLTSIYQARYGYPTVYVSAPGRFNLIGEHTDYNLGWVMPGAIDKRLHFVLGENSNPDEARVWAADLLEETVVSLGAIRPSQTVTWGNYLQMVLLEWQAAGYPLRGFCGVFCGDIPVGAGLSSSAALCCGLMLGLAALHGLDIPRPQVALMAQAAEHRIGLQCGLMDQYAVLFGRAGYLLQLDCRNLSYDYVPLNTKAYALTLLDSKVKHALAADSGYNERRQSCERIATQIAQQYSQVKSLRDATPAMLEAVRPQVDAVDYRRAKYVLQENERVLKTAELLRRSDWPALGALLWEAHLGLRHAYEVTCPETDFIANAAMQTPGVLGVRQVGGGFGGCVLMLVHRIHADKAVAQIMASYLEHTGLHLEAYPVETADGVEVVGVGRRA